MKRISYVLIVGLLLAPALVRAQQAGPYFRFKLQASGFTPPTGYLNIYAKSSNKHVYSKDSTGAEVDLTGGSEGAGTVTSVGMTVPSFLSVAGSPVTTSGTFALTLASQSANTVLAGPTGGGAATSAFRLLVAADLPPTAVSAGSCTACDLTIDAAGRITAKASGSGGAGDMILNTSQTVTALKTFGSGLLAATAPAFTGTMTGTYALGGTPSLAAALAVGTNALTSSGDVNIAVSGTTSRFEFSDLGGVYALYLGPKATNDYIYAGGNTFQFRANGVDHLQLGGSRARVYGGFGANITTNSTTSISANSGHHLLALSNVAARAVTMPAASSYFAGQELIVKDTAGTGASANITLTRAGSDLIDGATTKVISTNYGVVMLVSDGTSAWHVIHSQ